MASRLRLRPAGRPGALAVVAAVVLLVALVLVGRSQHLGGGRRVPARPAQAATASTQAPFRIGATVDCPPLWPVLAMSNHRSYPAGHPSRPPATAAAVACYQTGAQAARAGYPLAPVPPGALEIGGVYLTPTGRGLRASCQRAADVAGFGAACPGLLPTLPPGLPPPLLCEMGGGCRRGEPLVFSYQGFVVPFGYAGAPSAGAYGWLLIVTAPAGGAGDRPALPCLDEHPLATLILHGTRAVLADCAVDPQRSFFSGGVLLRWSEAHARVTVSALGHSEVNQRLVAAVAAHLRVVAPRSASDGAGSRGGSRPPRPR
jgi:hypothetical protein